MFWHETIPRWSSDDGRAAVVIWAGNNYFGSNNPNIPPPDSWAADPSNDVAIFHILLQPGGKLTLPKAHQGASVNRSLFYVEGGSEMLVDGKKIGEKVVLTVKADNDIELELPSLATEPGEFLLLQGKPISEPVAQYGPFVMNNEAEIQQAFMDYQRTQFGGWPWPRDDMVFPPEKARFAKLNGVELSASEATACRNE
jgi:redox-sensitive bicupin YhaK (pirin superfamily)